ncbi:hypothetical protein ACQ4PT_036030 [Festuca glaucescens]
MELQLATIETEDGDQHGTPTPSPSPTPSLDGALRLRAPGKGLVPGQRPAPPALGSNGQNRGGCTPVTSGTRGRPPLSAAAKHKNKNKAVTTCVTVDEISAPMNVDGGHVIISDDEDEQEEDVVAVNGAGKRKKTSNVWLEMKEVKVKGEYKARCNYCHKDLTTGPKAGTKHLADHLKVCTLKKLKTKGGKTMSQSSLMMNAKEDGNVSVESYTFDQEVARRELGNMLVLHEKDIVENFKKETKKAIDYMTKNQSRVAITTDMWTADSTKKAPHTANVICQELYDSLLEWNIDEKLMTVTVDNCTTNDKAIEMIVGKIGKKKLTLEGTLVHMHCCAHILNLIVKDGLDVMKSAIVNIRESVAYWTATGKRIEKFEEMAKFKKVKITRKLILDCKTRWNSTFQMLEIALPYRAVFERAKQTDKQYEYLPTDTEWEFAADVVDKLKLFYEITTLFSGTKYVTANIYFPKICEIKMKMRQWGTSTNPIIKNMAEEMATKFDKYWMDIQGLMGMATLLDPRYKRHMLTACFAMLHGIEPASYECIELVDDLVARLHALLEEYEVEKNEYKPCEEFISSKTPAIMNVFNDIVAKQSPAAARLQGEIEMYLSDALVPYTEKFDVLDWWKVAGTRYPTLRKVARDVFAIPVTTVASESAFSTSGKILSEHRSRLTPDMLEALMCSQDWLRNKYKDSIKGDASFWTCLQDIQEEMEELAI